MSDIKLDRVERTLLGTLSTRAKHDRLSSEIFKFLKEKDLVYGFDYFDFVPANDRTAIYDIFITDYIKENPKARILNVGCGFCTRFQRMKNDTVSWVNVDKPSVIALRRQFFGPDTAKSSHVSHDLAFGLPRHTLRPACG